MVLTTVDQAVHRARNTAAGPVHLNCAFREPLAPTVSEGEPPYPVTLSTWREGKGPYTEYAAGQRVLDAAQGAKLLDLVKGAQRGLLVLGELRNARERRGALALAEGLGWPTLPDVTSGLRLGPMNAPFVPYYDQLLLSERFRCRCKPDTVLHVGGRLVSKRLQQHLEAVRPEAYCVVANHPYRQDPGHLVTLRVEADLPSVFACFMGFIESRDHVATGSTEWLAPFRRANEDVKRAVCCALEDSGALTEPGVAQLVSRHAPEGSALFLGNSMPIRDMDMYGAARTDWLTVLANRGASGIDGNVATAIGAAMGAAQPLTAIIGDLALLHDLNSLALLPKTEAPVILVAINNDGGGVFHFLPIAEFEDVFEPYFGTPHGLTFEHAASMVGLAYASVDTEADFVKAYQASLSEGRSALIEVNIDRSENAGFHRALQGAVVDALL
jgi:2-succinyl-5-enolpyruvyl-6-hydroxy-3-cyclohexene-1-carboxylate synthase